MNQMVLLTWQLSRDYRNTTAECNPIMYERTNRGPWILRKNVQLKEGIALSEVYEYNVSWVMFWKQSQLLGISRNKPVSRSRWPLLLTRRTLVAKRGCPNETKLSSIMDVKS